MAKAVHTEVMTITLGIEEGSAVYQVEPGFPLANLEAQNEFVARVEIRSDEVNSDGPRLGQGLRKISYSPRLS